MKIKENMCNLLVKKASLYLEKMIYNNKLVIYVSTLFICMWINGWHPPVKIGTPKLQGGGKN